MTWFSLVWRLTSTYRGYCETGGAVAACEKRGWAIRQCVSGCQPDSAVKRSRITHYTARAAHKCMNEWRKAVSLVIKWVLQSKRQAYKFSFFMQPHDTFSHLRSFRSIRYKLRHPCCSFITDFTPTNTCQACCHRSLIAGCEEIMSLTTRQKGTDNCVKKCQVCAFVQVNTHTSPWQSCPDLPRSLPHSYQSHRPSWECICLSLAVTGLLLLTLIELYLLYSCNINKVWVIPGLRFNPTVILGE